MNADVDVLRRAVIGAAGAGTVAELGAALSAQVGRAVPHDGHLLVGLDPVTSDACLYTREHGYSAMTARRSATDDRLELDPLRLQHLVNGPLRVEVLGTTAPRHRTNARPETVMADQGVRSELRIALAGQGASWGALVLVRGQESRPFSADDAAHAELLTHALATALRGFVTRRPLQANSLRFPPGIIVVGPDDTVTSITPSMHQWRNHHAGTATTSCQGELVDLAWNIAFAARRIGTSALTRLPTASGWTTLHAQPLQALDPGPGPDAGRAAVAVTIRPTPGVELLPAMAAWHGLTRRERAVIEHALDGLLIKQIARRLSLSTHTVNDHLKAIYRKTGMSGRDELIARLAH